jgi:hypothetical protein
MARLLFEASRKGAEFDAKEVLLGANKMEDGVKVLHSRKRVKFKF